MMASVGLPMRTHAAERSNSRTARTTERIARVWEWQQTRWRYWERELRQHEMTDRAVMRKAVRSRQWPQLRPWLGEKEEATRRRHTAECWEEWCVCVYGRVSVCVYGDSFPPHRGRGLGWRCALTRRKEGGEEEWQRDENENGSDVQQRWTTPVGVKWSAVRRPRALFSATGRCHCGAGRGHCGVVVVSRGSIRRTARKRPRHCPPARTRPL